MHYYSYTVHFIIRRVVSAALCFCVCVYVMLCAFGIWSIAHTHTYRRHNSRFRAAVSGCRRRRHSNANAYGFFLCVCVCAKCKSHYILAHIHTQVDNVSATKLAEEVRKKKTEQNCVNIMRATTIVQCSVICSRICVCVCVVCCNIKHITTTAVVPRSASARPDNAQ